MVWHLHTILHWHHLISFHAFPSKKSLNEKVQASLSRSIVILFLLLCEKCKLKIIMSFSLSRLIYIFPVTTHLFLYISSISLFSTKKNLSFKEKECVFKQHSNCFLFTSSSFSLLTLFFSACHLFISIYITFKNIHTYCIIY